MFHIAFNVPYIRYLFSYIAQFQFFEALCKLSGKYNPEALNGIPLHLCDFSDGGEETGKHLISMMEKGSGQHWTKSMEELTGTSGLSGKPAVDYFFPLFKWMKEENAKRRGVFVVYHL